MTARSDDVLVAIVDLLREKGYPPTIREIGDRVGLSSTSTVHVHLQNLVREGRICHDPMKPRTIEVLDYSASNRRAIDAFVGQAARLFGEIGARLLGRTVRVRSRETGELIATGTVSAIGTDPQGVWTTLTEYAGARYYSGVCSFEDVEGA